MHTTTTQTPVVARDLPANARQRQEEEEDKRIRQEIQKGLTAAQNGDFVSNEDMNAFFVQHGVNVTD